MTTKTKKLIDKIAFIEIKEGKILSTRSQGKSKYYIPGGKRETGETDEETLIRELKEELTIAINPATIQYIGTFEAQADGHPDGISVKMTCYGAEYTGELQASSEIAEIVWLNFKDQDNIAPVDKLIFQFLKDRGDFE